jgi:hypothetical protein
VVVVMVIGMLIAGCGWLGVSMGVVAVSPRSCVQTSRFCVATAVVQEGRRPGWTCDVTHASRISQ